MKEKVKAFLSNTKVQVVELSVLAVTTAGLILGGVNVDGINSVVQLTSAGVTAIGAIVVLINSLVKKS